MSRVTENQIEEAVKNILKLTDAGSLQWTADIEEEPDRVMFAKNVPLRLYIRPS